MPIQAQYNPLRFYADKRSRQWENTENGKRIIAYQMYLDGEVYKCKIPQFSVIIDSLPEDPAPTVSAKVYSCDGTEIVTISDFATLGKVNYTQITYTGGVVACSEIDNYEIKLTINGVDYWSDMFLWTTELNDKLKITAESSKIRLGLYEYEMINNIHEFYVNLKPLSSNTYLKEEANENLAITSPNYGSSALIRSYNILANEPIFMFLRGLRILETNGSVVFTHKYISYQAKDITTEIESDVVNADLLNVKIEFKVLNESVSVFNG